MSHNRSLSGIERQCLQFGSAVQSVHAGLVTTYDFSGDSVVVTIDGTRKTPVQGRAFQQALLNVWFGPRSAETELRDRLLGLR